MIKNIFCILATLSCFVTVFGCASMDRTEKGALAGGAAGAGIGGIVGHQSGRAAEGALIGGAVGALGGGLVGHQMDKRQQEINPGHVSIVEIAEMGSEGVPSKAIIDEIKRTDSVYELDSETIQYLKNNGVEDEVIDYMLST